MIVVIGGGPAGRLGAMRLAQAGREVLLVEKKKIGGQCLHHGCMVVCALNDVARGVRAWQNWRDLGIAGGAPEISFPAMMKEMRAIQQRIETVLDEETRRAGVEIRYGSEGRCEGETLYVDDEPVPAGAGIIATGSRPVIPAIPGVHQNQVVTPHTLGQLTDLPLRLAIVGGGVIAAEFSYIFSGLGTEVTILSRSGWLKNLDPFLQKAARRALDRVTVRENTLVQEIRRSGRDLTLLLSGEEVLEVDAVLLATGLVPNSECACGVRKGSLGEIVVDHRMRTSAPGIYACGDVTGPPYLTPVARMEGMVAADTILGRNRTMDYRYLPQSIALDYDLLVCREEGGRFASVASPSPSGHESFWSVPSGNTGITRILVEPESGRLTGVEIAAPGSSLLGAYLSFLMRQGCTVQDLERIVEVHPSTDGILPLLRYMAEWQRKQAKQ